MTISFEQDGLNIPCSAHKNGGGGNSLGTHIKWGAAAAYYTSDHYSLLS